MNYSIIKKETAFNKPYGMNSRGNFTPYYFTDGKKEMFIQNLVTSDEQKGTHNRREMGDVLLNLRSNKFKFIKFYGGIYKTPLDFIKTVIEKGYTLQIHGELFQKGDGFTDFHGNLKEVSCSFMFRIYDKALLNKIKKEVEKAKSYFHYKRTTQPS